MIRPCKEDGGFEKQFVRVKLELFSGKYKLTELVHETVDTKNVIFDENEDVNL